MSLLKRSTKAGKESARTAAGVLATARFGDNVSPEEAGLLLASGAIMVDVREHGEWRAGHAPGALHHPLGEIAAACLPTDVVVVTVCRSGGRSARAASHLRRAGHKVHNLAGGMHAWHRAGLDVVRDDGSPGSIQ